MPANGVSHAPRKYFTLQKRQRAQFLNKKKDFGT